MPFFRVWWLGGCLALSMMAVQAASLDGYLPRTMARLRTGEPVTVVGFGDSITTFNGNNDHTGFHPVFPDLCYYGVFAQFLRTSFPKASIRVVNAGVGGNTTIHALQRIDKDVLALDPDVVFVMFGANDNGSMPLGVFEENLREIVRRLRADGPRDVVLLGTTPTPTDPCSGVATNRVVLRLGKELGVPTVDGFAGVSPASAACGTAGFPVRSTEELITFYGGLFPPLDPIHPNVQGHYLLGRYVYRALTGRPFPGTPLRYTCTREYAADGTSRYRLRMKNTTDQPVTGKVQVLLPSACDVRTGKRMTLPVPNGITASACILPRQALACAPHSAHEVTWESPMAQRVPTSADRWTYLDAQRMTPVVLFSQESGTCFLEHVGLEEPDGPSIRRIEFPTLPDRSARVALPSMPVTVTVSPGQEPLSVAVRWRGTRQVLPVPASGAVTVDLDVTGISDLTLVLATFQLVRTQGAKPQILDLRQYVVQVAPVLVAASATASPWQTISPIVPNVRQVAQHRARDLSGRFRIARQDKLLRMTWEVTDDTLTAMRDGFHTDGIELYFDRGDTTFQLGIFLPAGLVPGPARVAPGTGARTEDLASVSARWAPRTGGYTLAVDLPLAVINPADADIVRFSGAINDIDTPVNVFQTRRQFHWVGHWTNYWKVGRYGALSCRTPETPSVMVNVFP